VPLTSECCPTTCTILPNLLDEDDVAHWVHVSLGNQKTVFCYSIVSAILASCALPMIDSKFWMLGGSDHLNTTRVARLCVSPYDRPEKRRKRSAESVTCVRHYMSLDPKD